MFKCYGIETKIMSIWTEWFLSSVCKHCSSNTLTDLISSCHIKLQWQSRNHRSTLRVQVLNSGYFSMSHKIGIEDQFRWRSLHYFATNNILRKNIDPLQNLLFLYCSSINCNELLERSQEAVGKKPTCSSTTLKNW